MVEDKKKKQKKNFESETEKLPDGIRKLTTLTAQQEIGVALEDRDVQFQEAIDETKKEAEEVIKKEVDSAKKDMFLVFGVFASFVAFIVGQINIFNAADSISDRIGFSFIFIASILGFLFGIMFLMGESEKKWVFVKMLFIFTIFFGAGIYLLGEVTL